MILFFTGTPGSGKTYEAVKKILSNLIDGRVVYTNIDGMEDPVCHEAIKSICKLSDTKFKKLFHHLGTDRQIIENFWDHCAEGSFIVIDELQKFFSNRDWQSQKNKDFGDWASTHRHNGYDLIIITQNAERVDSAVRALAEWNYVYRKVNFFGGAVQKKYIQYSYAGDETSGQPLAKKVKTYNTKIFLAYKSYVSSDIKEQGIMQHVNVLKHPIFMAIPVVLGISIYMVFFKSSLATGDIFGTAAAQAKRIASVPEAQAAVQLPASKKTHSLPTKQLAKASIIQPEPIQKPNPITRRIKLNNIIVFPPGQRSYIKILFDGGVYTLNNFPYPISIRGREIYANIPLEYFHSQEDSGYPQL